jgi:hypothetical protein
MPVGEPHKAGRLAFRPTDLDDLTYALTGTAAEVDLVTDGCQHSQLCASVAGPAMPAPRREIIVIFLASCGLSAGRP